MALHHDLLEQASHLALREPKKPRQASLRRAVSAAYYALFHLLSTEGATRFAPPQPAAMRVQLKRAFAHQDMKDVCKRFSLSSAFGGLGTLLSFPLQPDLVAVANAFVELQEARHDADYDLTLTFNRLDVLQKGAVSARCRLRLDESQILAKRDRLSRRPSATETMEVIPSF